VYYLAKSAGQRQPTLKRGAEDLGPLSPPESQKMQNKLFVGGISFNTSENDLQDAFAAHGTVQEVNIVMDRETGKSKGFAFVTMSSAKEAEAAIAALNGKSLDGRTLTVNVARPKEERGGGGRGGGGGRRDGGGGGGYGGGGRGRGGY
jgi:cold-inducible RNA-binding protein